MGNATTPLRKLLNSSGIPFQLAVEKTIDTVGFQYSVQVIKSEVPWTNGFIDIVARRHNVLFAFECKRVDEKPWVFVLSDASRENWFHCRIESLDTSVSASPRIVCEEWEMQRASPEVDRCVVPKNTPGIDTLEKVCRELLQSCHALLEDKTIAHEGGFVPIVPVVLTTAKLFVCKFDPTAIFLETGKLDDSQGTFTSVDFVRFRKSLVTTRSNPLDASKMTLENWVADRQRTVFIVSASSLETFLGGFRHFEPINPLRFHNR